MTIPIMATIPQADTATKNIDPSNTATEKHLDITIVSSTVQHIPLLLPRTYVVVSCGDRTQKIVTTSRDRTQLWNKSFHFTFDASKFNSATEFNVRLYQQRLGKKDILLGQSSENLTELDRNTVITRTFAHELSVQFSVGNVTTASRTHAVIIGIDKYWSDEVPNLEGCVNDAKDMEDFLVSHLNVATSNIRVLHDNDATRHNILTTLKTHLLENSEIRHGDPIIIFFAGHGNRVAAPAGWASSDGKIETICPHDEWALVNDEATPGIPDRTINDFIRRLANAKGNNITLIFDSCHSGGIARGDSDGYTPRSFPNPCPVKTTTDKAIWGKSSSRGMNRILPVGFRYDDMSSHVLLAACKPNEFAGEAVLGNQHRGLFSSVLFQKLRESRRQSSSLSYAQIIQSITPLNRVQTPQCEGTNKDCLLFTLEAPIKSKLCFKIKPVKDSSGFEVELGSIHGVVVGTEFLVSHGPQKEPLGILCAEKVHPKRTILARRQSDPEFTIPDGAEALVWNWNNMPHVLKVFANFKNPKKLLSSSMHSTSNFRLEESKSDAHVCVSVTGDGKKYQITRLPNFLSGHDIKGQPQEFHYQHQYTVDQLPLVLDSLFRFRYHLAHTDKTSSRIAVGTGSSTDALVKMRLFRLGTEEFGFPVPATGEDIFDQQGTATLTHSDIAHNYGIQITNESSMDLFTYLFYFDPFDCSIQEWYLPPSEHMDPPLASERALTIGYGANGGDPFNFSLEEGQTEGTGFFKVYVSTTYVDMSYLTQSSPFGAQSPSRMSKKGKQIALVDVFGSFVGKIAVIP